jgi:methylmalonyl-CoA/ethylmalonyl-CoA epimerase
MLSRFSHIGVLVRDLPATVERFRSALGAKLIETGHLSETNTDVAVLDLGGVHLELLSSRQSDSKVGRLLGEKGEGIHHISFEVEDIRGEMTWLQQTGVELTDKVPRRGLHGREIAFLAAQDTAGILIELTQETTESKENG